MGRSLRSLAAGVGRAAFELAYKTLRDVDVADFEGDGKKEILVATSTKTVVALDSRLEKLWATRLDSPATVMKVFAKPDGKDSWIAAGCEDGSVAILDAKGALVGLGAIGGTPVDIETMKTDVRFIVLLATDEGEIRGFQVTK
ncbi:MAG: hypothetical protein ACYTG0_03425 [Planctomycetota bacterium]